MYEQDGALECLELFHYENRIGHKIHSFNSRHLRFLNTRDGNYIAPLDEGDEPGQDWEADGEVENQSGTDEKKGLFAHTKCVLLRAPKCL